MRITALISYKSHDYTDRIKFEHLNIVGRKSREGEKRLRYGLEQWNKIDSFDSLNNISEDVILVNLMTSLGNVNRAVSVVVK